MEGNNLAVAFDKEKKQPLPTTTVAVILLLPRKKNETGDV
jgi:hypothetical protein